MMNKDDSDRLRLQIDDLDTRIEAASDRDKKQLRKEKTDQLKTFYDQFKVEEIKPWIASALNEQAITFSEFFGRYAVMIDLTTSQIRNIYGEVKRMEMQDKFPFEEFLLLKPRLAYATERKGTPGSKEFRKVMTVAIDTVIAGTNDEEKQKRFENFTAFFESILAYHKSYGGK